MTDEISWPEPDWALQERRADTSVGRAAARASAFGVLLAIPTLGFIGYVGLPVPTELILAVAALFAFIVVWSAVAPRYARRSTLTVNEEQLGIETTSTSRYVRWRHVTGFQVDAQVVHLNVAAPRWFQSYGQLQPGVVAVPLPDDPDLRDRSIGLITRVVDDPVEFDLPPKASELPTSTLIRSYTMLVVFILACAPYAMLLIAPFWFNAIPLGLSWKPWTLVWACLVLLAGPGTLRSVVGAPMTMGNVLAGNALGILFAMAWSVPASLLLTELYGLP